MPNTATDRNINFDNFEAFAGMPSTERRGQERWHEYAGCRIAVEGRLGTLVDLSEGGAKFESPFASAVGDSVRVDLPWGVPVRAVILATESRVARVRFESPIESPLG